MLRAFSNLENNNFSDCDIGELDKFACKIYAPNTKLCTTTELRWWMFHKRNCIAEKLPPTKDALRQAILRAQHQSKIWTNAVIANPEDMHPADYG